MSIQGLQRPIPTNTRHDDLERKARSLPSKVQSSAPKNNKGESRPSVAEALSQRSGVRAMAAMFETDDAKKSTPPASRRESGAQFEATKNKFDTNKAFSTKHGDVLTPKASWSSQQTINEAVAGKSPLREVREPSKHSLIPRAVASVKQEPPLGPIKRLDKPSNTSRLPAPVIQSRQDGYGASDKMLSKPPSLGTMIPHQEEPPIAQHLTFSRPSSTVSVADPALRNLGINEERASTPTGRPGSKHSCSISTNSQFTKTIRFQNRRDCSAPETIRGSG